MADDATKTPADNPAPTDERVGESVADNPNPELTAEPTPPAAPEPAPAGDDDERPAKRRANPRDEQLKRIADRIKAQRRGGPAGDNDAGEARAETPRDLLPAFVRPTAAPEPEPPPAPAPAPAPEAPESTAAAPSTEPAADPEPKAKRLTLRVDREELDYDLGEVARLADMTIEEVEQNPDRAIRYAQKEIAATRRLDKANSILRGAQERPDTDLSRRAPGSPAHPQDETRATDTPEPEPAPPGDTLEKLVEEIQFGADPKEVAGKLRTAVTEAAKEVSARTSIEQRMHDDFVQTMQTYESFQTANKELVADPNAHAVMRRMLFDAYGEDLRAIGVPEDRIPADEGARADWHRFYRVKGYRVRGAEKLLTDVKDDYVRWRTPAADPPPAPRPATTVTVDRAARRQAIPSQPTRATPPQQAPTPPPQRKTRAQILQEMRKARGQPAA
jgi:hypothetical protein